MKRVRCVCWVFLISLVFLTACGGKKESGADKKNVDTGEKKETIETTTEEVGESQMESTEIEETVPVPETLQADGQDETAEEVSSEISLEMTEEAAEEPTWEVTEEMIAQTERPVESFTEAEPVILYAYTDTGDEALNRQCDQVLDTLINNAMAEREKAYAIYQWVESHIRYSGVTPENGWVNGAKTALATGKGNCYAFYSVSAALLTRAGFENLQVNEPDNSHYWNLVKVDGSWYHWDTTAGWGGERFLLTDAQLEAYAYYNASVGETLSYHWDHASVPATP